jgi:serine/threonine protein kinase
MRTRSEHPPQAFHPAWIGHYEVLRRLGAGAMGEVYLARSASSRLVAVKTIRAGFAEHPGYRRRFAHEVDAARRVSGAFTAAVVDADPDAGLPWLATVYVPAPSLEELVAACGPLPVAAVRWLAAGCADALACVHRAGLVHRDLKPANVLVTADGPRVIDFGLARTDGLPQGTVAGMVLGTPLYMAPEQAAGEPHTGTAADIFSLGATLIHAATGSPPYHEAKAMGAILQMMTEPPDLRAVPDELRDLLSACLNLDPAARPTPAALIATLAPHLSGVDTAPPLPAGVLDYIENYRNTQMELALSRRSQPDVISLPPAAGGQDGAAADAAAADADAAIRTPHPSLLPTRALSRRRPRPARRRRGPLGTSAVAAGVSLAVAAAIFSALLLTGTVRLGGDHARDAAPPPAPAPAASSPARPGPPLGGPPPQGPPPGAFTEVGGVRLAIQPPFGDPRTTFVLHGSGWPPDQSVTVGLVDVGVPTKTLVDSAGNFSYAVNAHHELIAGDLPDGRYRIRAALGARSEAVSFVIGPPLNP